jgi:hypothetical protein
MTKRIDKKMLIAELKFYMKIFKAYRRDSIKSKDFYDAEEYKAKIEYIEELLDRIRGGDFNAKAA